MRKPTRRWLAVAALAAACAALLGVGARWLRAPDASALGPLGPLSAFALPGAERLRFEGRVVERVNAGSYTYLQIERAEGTRSWVVTLASSQGARSRAPNVRVVAMGYADRFVSKRLNRSFDGLYFAVVRPA